MTDRIRRHLHAQADTRLRRVKHYDGEIEQTWTRLDELLRNREASLTEAAEFRAAAQED